jgi:hypothetical protein
MIVVLLKAPRKPHQTPKAPVAQRIERRPSKPFQGDFATTKDGRYSQTNPAVCSTFIGEASGTTGGALRASQRRSAHESPTKAPREP